jgi:orotate phosphoribosyltransferase-like protein
MSSADEIAAAFGKVDELLVAATAAAPAVALLAATAAKRGITEAKLAAHLHLNATTMRWLLKLEPAAADRSIDLDGDDLGELVLRWARAG